MSARPVCIFWLELSFSLRGKIYTFLFIFYLDILPSLDRGIYARTLQFRYEDISNYLGLLIKVTYKTIPLKVTYKTIPLKLTLN